MGEQQLKIRIVLTHPDGVEPPAQSADNAGDRLSAAAKGKNRGRRGGPILAYSAALAAGLSGAVWLGFGLYGSVVGQSSTDHPDGSQVASRQIQAAPERPAPVVATSAAPQHVVASSVPEDTATQPPPSTAAAPDGPESEVFGAEDVFARAPAAAISDPAVPPPQSAAGAAPTEPVLSAVAAIASLEVEQRPVSDTRPISEGVQEMPSNPSPRRLEATIPNQVSEEPLGATVAAPQSTPAVGLASADVDPLERSGASNGRVARAQFTTGIRNREPVDRVAGVHRTSRAQVGRLYYFTELKNLQGRTLTHRWSLNGENQAEVRFEVRGPNWRVYSSKYLTAAMAGQWRVDVEDAGGRLFDSASFVLEVDE